MATHSVVRDREEPARARTGGDRTHLFAFGLDETIEGGCDLGEPVSSDYTGRGNEFSGKVNWVQIDIDAAAKDVDHMIGGEERFRFAMMRQ